MEIFHSSVISKSFNRMSPSKVVINYSLLFCHIAGQALNQKLESLGLFEFRSTNWHSVDDSKTDDFFADSNTMYDTLYETVLNTDSAPVNDVISNETKIQKINTYARLLTQLSLFRILNADDLVQMTGQKRHTWRNIQLNKNSLKGDSRQWTLLTDDLLEMIKVSGRKRRTLTTPQLSENSLPSKSDDQWTLLTKFFYQK